MQTNIGAFGEMFCVSHEVKQTEVDNAKTELAVRIRGRLCEWL